MKSIANEVVVLIQIGDIVRVKNAEDLLAEFPSVNGSLQLPDDTWFLKRELWWCGECGIVLSRDGSYILVQFSKRLCHWISEYAVVVVSQANPFDHKEWEGLICK